MAYSTEFRRAIAAAAVTRLIAGRRNLAPAAEWVSNRIGTRIFPDQTAKKRTQSLLEYRKKILGVDPDKPGNARLSVARFHYDNCLKLAKDCGLPIEQSAALLIDTLIAETKS